MLSYVALLLTLTFSMTKAGAEELFAKAQKPCPTKGDVKVLRSSVKDLIRRTGGFELIKTQLADVVRRIGKLEKAKGSASSQGGAMGGGLYTRWGRKTCPKTAKQVYTGVMASEWYHHIGGGANYLCLPVDNKGPDYDKRLPTGPGNGGFLYGVEYETHPAAPFRKLHDEEAPCAVCETKGQRSKVLMIPSKMTCPAGWTKEYSGFLMSEHYTHKNNKQYVCVDGNMEYAVASQKVNKNGGLLYFIKYQCSSLHCETGKFRSGGTATCVVCTKN